MSNYTRAVFSGATTAKVVKNIIRFSAVDLLAYAFTMNNSCTLDILSFLARPYSNKSRFHLFVQNLSTYRLWYSFISIYYAHLIFFICPHNSVLLLLCVLVEGDHSAINIDQIINV